MNPERRPLRFDHFDAVMPDVERLLEGHRTVGQWSLAQICRHLAIALRRVVDMPASTPVDTSLRFPEERIRAVFEQEALTEGLAAPPQIVPAETRSAREEAEGLRAAIAHYRASASGPVVPHRYFGPLTKAEWDHLQLIHLAHHLSFAIPTA